MKRGVISINIHEAKEMLDKFPDGRLTGSPLEAKLTSVVNIGANESPVELSEEELEIMLDEIAIPDPSDSQSMINLRKKLQKQLIRFRESEKSTI